MRLPRLQRGLADTRDDVSFGPVLIGAVVDLTQEEFGFEFRR